jgi:hypothetical protein
MSFVSSVMMKHSGATEINGYLDNIYAKQVKAGKERHVARTPKDS